VTDLANVDLVRSICAAINEREVPKDLLAPDLRMENVVTAVSDKTYYGAAGFRDWMQDLFAGFAEGARFEIEEIVADGDDFVVAVLGAVGCGARSGAPLVLRWVNVAWFRDGKATRSVGYASRREALMAVGLEK
jgi:ketosteroid isomerase-like protein